MYNEKIREKLKRNGYYILDGSYKIAKDYISPAGKYHQKGEMVYLGLILENEKSEYVTADIRNGEEGLVVLPRDEEEKEQIKNLRKILEEKEFRDEPYKN